jgi:hypothetical protein
LVEFFGVQIMISCGFGANTLLYCQKDATFRLRRVSGVQDQLAFLVFRCAPNASNRSTRSELPSYTKPEHLSLSMLQALFLIIQCA